MGFIKDLKANSVAVDARKAIENDRRVFVARLNMPSGKANGLSGAIDDWAVMIEAIEDEGWSMDRWSTASDDKGRSEVHLLFRR